MNSTDAHQPSVLITRPVEQSETFAQLCTDAGFNIVLLPALRIRAIDLNPTHLEAKRRVASHVLFTSANAVRFAHTLAPLPWDKKIVAIGAATARSLKEHNQPLHFEPEPPYNSEAFLAQLNAVKPGSLLIAKGIGGRSLIQTHLADSDWQVDTVDLYRRDKPQHASEHIDNLFQQHRPDIISVSSDEVLANLWQLCSDHRLALTQSALVVNSERCRQLAISLGFTSPILVAEPAGDEGQLAALRKWKQTRTKM